LHSLFVRRSTDRFYPLAHRLEKAPQYIEEFKTRVVNPTKLWTEMALEAVEGFSQFLQIIVEEARKGIPSEDAEEIEDTASKVEESTRKFSTFLKGMLPKAVTPSHMGSETYEKLLKLRKLPYKGDEILNLGWTWYNKEMKRLETLAESIAPGKSVIEVTNMIKNGHPPTFEDVLKVYRRYIIDAQQFIIDNDLLTLPQGEKFTVDVMPEFLRHWLPIAACFSAPVVGEDRVGYLYVTPHKDLSFLKEHTEPFVVIGCIHEGYPGHHIQLWCAGMHPHRVRWRSELLSSSPEMVEGWAHYCEELMMEKGFVTAKEYQFMQSRAVLWRAARIIVDVQLSRGDMSFDEAVLFLENMGMEHPAAVGEVRWYTLYPSYPLSYLLGKNMLKDLKKRVKKELGSKYTDKFFHDTLLYEGTMPLALYEEVFDHKIKKMLV
jgi:uncharacterized protein (DUF885 family)